MTDTSSDPAGDGRRTEPDEPGGQGGNDGETAFRPEQDSPAASPPDETADEPDDDGLAIHIVEPQSAGTLFVAVADPSELLKDNGDTTDLDDSPDDSPGDSTDDSPDDFPDDAEFFPGGADIPVYGDLVEIAAVRLAGLGPALFFITNGVACAAGDKVVVDMEEGQVLGTVASVMRMNPDHIVSGEGPTVRPVARKATEKDLDTAESNAQLSEEALEFCSQCVRDRDLDMKLVDVLILLDRGKMVFYFTAPSRIDFRELVKDLVRRYRTRIELRQIGVRHETQMVGALGNCGMVCCCRRYLRKFAPVAIKMAKEQNVFLNPVKISGICGRLLCCLAYEQEHYDEFYRSCPKLGKKYHTDAGVVRVLRASLFRESVTVLSETGEEAEYPLSEWNAMNPFRPNAPQQQQPSRKQDQQGGDGGKRRSGGRNAPRAAQPDFPHDPQPGPQHAPQHHRKRDEAAHDIPAAPDTEELQPSFVVTEEETLVVSGPEGIAVQQSRSVTAVFTEDAEAGDGVAPDTEDDDDAGAAPGGSIFGLSPRRETASSDASAHADGDARRKRPHRRRKPRPAS